MKKLIAFGGALPFFFAVFLNAFVDLGHKIIVQNTVFKTLDGAEQVVLTAIVNALILLPFILLFSPAGFCSDKYPKNRVMRMTSWAALGLTLMITLSYYLGLFWLAFAMTFLLAVQSAFYSPAKLGYIKALFGKDRLAEANGVAQATSIVAILSGTFLFSLLFEIRYPGDEASQGDIILAIAPVGWLLVINSVIELIMVYRLPDLEAVNKQDRFDVKAYVTGKLARQNLQPLATREVIRLSIVGLAMFWSVGQVMLAAFPAFAKDSLGETNTLVIQGILAAAGLGIALGSFLAGRASRDHIELGLIPIGAAGIALGLWLITSLDSAATHALNYFFIGTMGGLFIVPLNSLIQFHAGEHELGRILAANNWVQNMAMLGFLILTAAAGMLGLSSAYMLVLIAMVGVAGGLYTVYKLPQSLLRLLLRQVLSSHYRIRVQGLKNIPSTGGVLMLGNHISWIDWAIVQIACPRPVRFVMLASIYQRWYLRWFLKRVGCIPIEQGASSQHSLDQVAELLGKGQVVCLFPEGGLSRTGHLGTFRTGYQRACEKVGDQVVILPFYLRGLWGSYFSRSSAWTKRQRAEHLKRDLIVAFGPAIPKDTGVDVLKRRIFDLSIQSWQRYVDDLPTLDAAWIDSVKRSRGRFALTESAGPRLSARQLLATTLPLARRIRKRCPEQNIGIMLPASGAGVVANMAVWLGGKTAVHLDRSLSADALEQAGIETIFTSRQYTNPPTGQGLRSAQTIYLEDLQQTLGRAERTGYRFATFLPAFLLKTLFCRQRDASATAAIVFTSGTTAAPKGVMFSHRNIMANVKQVAEVFNADQNDVVMSSLPWSHAFGMTVNQFMPLIEGIPMVCHPDPSDALGIARSIARYRATLLCSSSASLQLFVDHEKIHPLMLNSLRLVVAGGEKLDEQLRTEFKLKFNRDVLEGYGSTETSPVASVNLPDALDTTYWQVQCGGKAGTVGMALPGTSIKIVDPQTYRELPTGTAGLVLVGGPQVMAGYLNAPAATDAAITHLDGIRWYVTGDLGYLDEDGFLTIVDRIAEGDHHRPRLSFAAEP
ncbi:MAG: acyl-[ACP]--phospholipid O-acyltransferase [Cellvibrionaceae bacterium]